MDKVNDLVMSVVEPRQIENTRKFFLDFLHNCEASIKCDEDKLVENMCEAFWEDVFIELNMRSLLFFNVNEAMHISKDDLEEDLLVPDENNDNKYNLFAGKNKEDSNEIKKKYESLKKWIKPDVWEEISPFFLYILPDLDENIQKESMLRKIFEYDYIFSLGLLRGKRKDFMGETLLDAIFKDASNRYYHRISNIFNNLEKREDDSVELNAQERKVIEGWNDMDDSEMFCDLMFKEPADAFEKLKSTYGQRALGDKINNSGNFEYMKKLMQNTKHTVNKGYVIFCFNLLTDWFNYSLYLEKKDASIFSYKGLALKMVAKNVFYFENLTILVAKFWTEAECRRKEIVESLIGSWENRKCVYKHHEQLYDAVIKNRLNLGTKRDFLEYWEFRFIDGEEAWEKCIEKLCMHKD